ncbi:S24 family peptidase [Acidovorax sp. Leaf160]|uniref:S24 family peptidase n=1 Tax=Acidovorax sp. Leaf160 TaxID=1736280 RepID=UPI0006FBF55C|nr:S24 family peptidase [Acidovorax sp. Leaf160]KQR62636.1 hypothetical protein ASF94_15565 [Acidovorax sp. Leaf160]
MRDDHRKARLAHLIKTDYGDERKRFMDAHEWVSKSRLSQVLGSQPFAEDAGFEWAERIGLPRAWFNNSWPTPKESKALGIPVDQPYPGATNQKAGSQFSAGVGEKSMEIPWLDVRVAAGEGRPHGEVEAIGGLSFRSDFLRDCGIYKNEEGVILNVTGESMGCSVWDGSVVLVNTKIKDPVKNKIFVFVDGEGPVVKRVVQEDGRWIARSDNTDKKRYPDFPFGNGHQVIGQAVWMGAKL